MFLFLLWCSIVQSCFLSYTGLNGKVHSTERGKGWNDDGIDAYNRHLMNVYKERRNKELNKRFDMDFTQHCLRIHKHNFDNKGMLMKTTVRKNVKTLTVKDLDKKFLHDESASDVDKRPIELDDSGSDSDSDSGSKKRPDESGCSNHDDNDDDDEND